ncbi:13913_t:CDS:2 [Funneliformis mosseae]|uniref:13913_t:CDS:1 n=1 Tax=Funneliformis mosseae TaxID=27381 RepID=A0A9N9GYI9_FUNMO|nr:13913_t:CDS:2 [Funneliformis mosseae]
MVFNNLSHFLPKSLTKSTTEMKNLDIVGLNIFLKEQRLGFDTKHFETLNKQEVDGNAFLGLTYDKLIVSPYILPGGLAVNIARLVKEINGPGKSQGRDT